MPLNIKEYHWVLAYIDLRNRHVFLYDSNLNYGTNRDEFKALWIMLPYILRCANFFEGRPEIRKYMGKFSHSYVEDCPRQQNGCVLLFSNFALSFIMNVE